MWRNREAGFLVAAILAGVLSTPTVSAQVLWSHPWSYTTPLLLDTYPSPSIVFTEDGGAILGTISGAEVDRKTTRISADGEVQWSSSLYGYRAYFEEATGSAFELEDGGAVVTLSSTSPYINGEISRLGPSGNILWSRSAHVSTVARLDANHLVYSGCNIVTVADLQTGIVLWQKEYDRSANCIGSSNSVVDEGNIYATFSRTTGNQVTGYRVVKTDLSGLVQWNETAQVTGAISIVGAGTSALYLKSNSDLIATSMADGSTLWSIPISDNSIILVTDDVQADPIVIDYNSARRLSAASGGEIWSAGSSFCTWCARGASITSGSVVALTNYGLSLVKINAVTGATDWTTELPTEDLDGKSISWLGFGHLAGNQLLGVASARSEGASTAHFQPIDFNSGELLPGADPSDSLQGLVGNSVVEGNDVFDSAFGADQENKLLHLRRTDATTGVSIWETSVPALPEYFTQYYDPIDQTPYISVGDDAIATATAAQAYSQDGPLGLTYVTLFDRSTGNLRWSKLLWEDYQRLTYASVPQFDSAGNVFVGAGTKLPCNFGFLCAHKFIYKLSAQDGDVLWRFDNTDPPGSLTEGSSQVFPQRFEVFGDDVVVAGSFSDTTDKLRRLSGADASVKWSSSLFSSDQYGVGFYRQDDQHIIVGSSEHTGRMDINNANVLWTSPRVPLACTQTCYGYDHVVLPDGDVIAVGEGDSRAWVSRTHNDGSGQVDTWWLGPPDPQFRSFASFVSRAPSGKIMLHQGRRYRGSPGKLNLLLEVDPTNGAVLSQQVLANGTNDATTEILSPIMTDFTEDNRMLFNGYRISETLPYANGAGLLDTSILQHGNIELLISVDRQHVVSGESLGFQLLATYSGDLPIQGARLFAGSRLPGGMISLDCVVQAASNCVIDTRSGNVNATFDIQPGGSVSISGQMIVVAQDEAYYLSAVASGPVSLSETDTIDNFSRAKIVSGLFQDGFDQLPAQ